MRKKMLLLDGNSLMHRAFHALPAFASEAGEPTGALHGFFMMLAKVISEEKPEYAAAAFDMHGPTFRHLEYAEYKAGRPPTPDELRRQFQLADELLSDMRLRRVTLPGFEADDIIGSLARRCAQSDMDAVIVTGDRDSFQLASDRTTILYTVRGVSDVERVTPEYIKAKWELVPAQLIDMKGLMGDSSDNIPGISGIGEKTARKLLVQYSSLEGVLEHASEQKGKLRERLEEGRAQALFSKRLATIDVNAPVAESIADCALGDISGALPALERLGLRAVTTRLRALSRDARFRAASAARTEISAPEAVAETVEAPSANSAEFAENLKSFSRVRAAAYIGALCCVSDGEKRASLPLGGDLISQGVTDEEAARLVAPLISEAREAVVYDLKSWLKRGVSFGGRVSDVMLSAYALRAQRKSYTLAALCEEAGLKFDEENPAVSLLALNDIQRRRLSEDGLMPLVEDIELPLAGVLAEMEKRGFLTDAVALRELGAQYDAKLASVIDEIRAIAGEELNINSPKQVGELLFVKLGLRGGKKTKTGYSTDAAVLEELADEHPVVRLILEYRKYAKLKSTYIDALLRLRGEDGRVHTSFDQVSTATGRISSLEPNLQNIPTRTPLGRDIRKCFVAPEGWLLVDADYSQIELRVLAHMSGDETMKRAFLEGRDIHQATAAEVYGVSESAVTAEMRSAAKAVNFGIVYGISDFGLAKNIGVSRQEAAKFIATYFERYPDVKKYMDERVAEGARNGYVTTMAGRRRYLPELNDRSYTVRQFGERAAMNSPIQGSAADIIKLAMIRVSEALKREGFAARLILQVHDELIVEAPEEEAAAAAALVQREMEGAWALSTPLVAEATVGKSWYDCK